MLLTSFLHQLKRLGNRILSPSYSVSRDHQRRLPQRLRARGSRAESLEVRTLLAAVAWDGGAGTTNWDDATNWNNNAVPAIADDVTIVGAAVTVTRPGFTPLRMNTLELSNATLNVTTGAANQEFGLSADQIRIDGTSSIVSSISPLAISPRSDGQLIDLGGSDSSSQLGLTDAEIDRISSPSFALKTTASGGSIVVTSDISRSSSGSLVLFAYNDVVIQAGQVTNAGPFEINSFGASFPKSGIDVNATLTSLPSLGQYNVAITGSSPDTGYSQINVVGGINLNASRLNVTSTFIPSVGQSFTLVNNDGTDSVISYFSDSTGNGAEGSILTFGANRFRITYRGGDGNDVVLTKVGAVVITATPGSNDSWTLQQIDSQLVVSGFGASPLSYPFDATESLTFELGDGDDLLTIDYGASQFIRLPVTVRGQAGTNTVSILGGTVSTATFNTHGVLFDTDGSGPIAAFGAAFSDIQSVLSAVTTTEASLSLINTSALQGLLEPGPGSGTIRLQNTTSPIPFEMVVAQPSSLLTIGGSAALEIRSLPDYHKTLTLGASALTITGTLTFDSNVVFAPVSDSFTLSAGASVATTGSSSSVRVTADAVSISGTASIVSPGFVVFRRGTSGNVSLGTEVSGQLSLTDAELDRVSGTTYVGNQFFGSESGVTTTTAIAVSSPITASQSMHLRSSQVSLTASVVMAADKSLTVTSTSPGSEVAFATSGTIYSTSGTGSISVSSARNVTVGNNVTVTTQNGGVAISANSAGIGTGFFNGGVFIAGIVETTGTGTVFVEGRGSAVAGSDYQRGVAIEGSGAQVRSTAATNGGPVRITGRGGSGRTFNAGVSVYSNALVTTISGSIIVNGTGGTGTGDLMIGVTLQSGGVIESTASGSVSITGTGGSGTGNNHWGVDLAGSTVRVSTVNGPLNVTGIGTSTTGVNSHGVAVITGASIITTGTGNITVNASGYRGYGLLVHNLGKIETSGPGNLFLTGQGGDAGAAAAGARDGIMVELGASVRSTSTAANAGAISMTGFGGDAPTTSGFSRGVIIEGSNGTITPVSSVNGNISIVGVGGNQSARQFSDGVAVVRGGRVDSTGTATITINGTGGGSSGESRGFVMHDNASRVSSSLSNVTIIGLGGTTSSTVGDSHGVSVNVSSMISVGGGGTLSITGTGGTGGANNRGVVVNGSNALVTSTTGAMTIRGFGGSGTGNLMEGVALLSSGSIASTAGAPIRIEGTGGSGPTGANIGIECWDSSSLTSNAGAVTLVGVGGTGGGFNVGITVHNSATVSMTGSAALTATGTGGTGGNDNWGLLVGVGGVSTVNGNMSLTGIATATTQVGHYGVVVGEGAITTSGTGSILVQGSGTTAVGVQLGNGARITSTSSAANAGTITVVGSSTHSDGVILDGYTNETTNTATYIRSVAGNVSVTGNGGPSATDSFVDGIVLFRKGQIESTGNATITINGTAGRGVSWNRGVVFSSPDSFVKSVNGQISITGQGGASTTTGAVLGANLGVRLEYGAVVQSTGTAPILINGTGGTGGHYNYGVTLVGSGTVLTSAVGAISVVAQAGSGTGGGSHQHGLILEDAAAITSTGSATITVDAVGGPGASESRAVFVAGTNSRIESTATGTGAVTIVGQGGTTTDGFSMGVSLLFGGKIRSLNNAPMNITGHGGSGTIFNNGVEVVTSGSEISTKSGVLSITGVAGGSGVGDSNLGVSIQNFGVVRSTLDAPITINGTGGLGLDQNDGVAVWETAELTTVNGAIVINGIGRGARDRNDGVAIVSGGKVASTGTGPISITGSGVGAFRDENYGVIVEGLSSLNVPAKVLSAAGQITIDGHGGHGTGHSNFGVLVANAASVEASGSAGVVITGEGGSGSYGASGIVVLNNSAKVTAVNGSISMTGAGGLDSPDGYSDGIAIFNSGVVRTTGSGAIELTGSAGPGPGATGLDVRDGGVVETTGFVNLHLTADSIDLSPAGTVAGYVLRIDPLTSGVALDIGGEDGPGVLGLSDDDLGALDATYHQFGDDQTGPLSVSGVLDLYVVYLNSEASIEFVDDGAITAAEVRFYTTDIGGVLSSSSADIDVQADAVYFFDQTADIGSFARPIRIATNHVSIDAAGGIDAYLEESGDTRLSEVDVAGGVVGLMGGSFFISGNDVIAPGGGILLANSAVLLMEEHGGGEGDPAEPSRLTVDRLILAGGDITGESVITILTELEGREGNIDVELTGPGLVRKTTAGRVDFFGPASYTGLTLIEEGSYWIYDETGLGESTAGTVVAAGAELYVAGTHVINEPLTLAGELAIGTFVAGSYVLWEADIVLVESAPGVYPAFEANDPPDLLEITGAVSGASGLSIIGEGTVLFTNAATYAGPTIVEEGTLAFAVSITGDVDLETDATLQTLSAATTIFGSLDNRGTVVLGSPYGRLHVTVNYLQAATGAFIVDLEGTTPGLSLDRLDVDGDVTLDGDVNFNTFNAFQSTSGNSIILIRNGGANLIEGDFDNAEEGELVYPGGLGPYQLTYFGGDGNDVELLPLTVYVTATADAGVGSFRQSILDINRLFVPGQILFHIDGTGPFEIQIESALPVITSTVTIDASPPPDSFGPYSIELIGQAGQPGAAPDVNGLEFLSSDSQLIGLSITRFTGIGVYVSGNRMTLRANFIGTNVEGRPGLGNLGHGLVLDEVNETILGDMDAEEHRNVVSGNLGSGIIVYGGSLTSFGTWVGLAPDGESALGNGQAGMVVYQATLLELQDAVISGNAGDGLRIDDRTLDILIEESRIGVSNSGTRAVGNGGIGLRLDRSDVLTTASQFQIYDSVISDNDAGGLWINDQRTAAGAVVNYDVSFNQFGLNEAGTVGMGNGQFGVKLEGSPVLDVAPGTAHFVGNTASGNDGPGLWLENLRGWSIRESRFGTDSNGLFAIPNDTGLYVHNSSALSSESFVDPGFYHASDYIQASGNRQEGVRIVVDDQTLPIILGEVLIGTDASGTYAIPNSRGISLDMSDNDFTSVGLHGVVSGNLGPGVVVSTTGISYDRLVLNLRVGTDVTGTEPLSNRGSGIVVASDTVNAIIHPESIIAFNRGPGVRHEGIGDGSNIHLGSLSYAVPPVPRVFGNTGLAVDLGAPGPTTNNGTATDHPVILSAVLNSGFLNITGTNSATNAHFIQFYTTRPTVSGRGQGQEVVGFTGRLQGPGFPAGLSNYLNTIGAGPFLEDLLPDAGVFAFQIPVGPDFDARLLTAVTVDPTFGVWPSLSGVSEFSPIVPIGTQLTALPPVVDAGGDTQLFAGDRLTRSVTFRDDDSVEFEVVVDFGDGGGFEYAQYRPADRSIVLDHTYHDTGVYVVSVSVLDDSTPVGLFDIDTFRVTVTNTPPEIRFNEVQLTKRIREGETVDLQGLFDDIGLTDLHTIEVNWGDGTPTTSAYLPIGARSFDVQHTFLDDGVSLADSHVYRVVVTVRDDSGSVSATPVFLVEVDNVLPGWPPLPQVGGDPFVPALELDDNNIVEGESIELSGRFYDPGLIDSHLIYVNWGDGSPREKVSTSAITQAGARRDFRISHVYGDSPANGSTFTISVELSDDDDPYGIITNSLSVTVANAAPVIDSFEAGFSTPEENVLVPVSVVFLDAGREPHIVTINWGDGTPPEVIYTAPGTIFVSPAHTYLQDGFYTATAIVTDRDGAVSDPASVTISVGNLIPELAPIIVAPATTIVEGDEVLLSGSFSDESLLDNPVITVAWDDGTTSTASIDRTNRTWAARHQFVDDDDPANSGSRDFSVVVSLNDGTDVVTRSTTITVQNERPTLSVIPVIDTTTTNPVFRAAAMDRSPEDRLHLMYNWSVTLDGVPLTYILHGPDEIEVVLSDGTASGGGPGGGTIGLGGTIVISVTVADDDGGVSDEWKARIIHGTAGNDRLTISNSDYSTGIARIIVLGLGGNDLLDASGVTAPGRSVVMYGGTGNDLLFDGSGNDLIVLGAGNDSLNIPVDDPRNSFVDGLGDPYSITPNEGGEDEVIAIANSVLEVWDNVGNNTLNFALNHSAISQSFGITFDLSLTVQTSSTQALTHQDVAPASGEPATHFVGALGNFTKLIGSDYGDQLTGASNATVSGGRGADQLTVKAGTINAGFVGGADDDVLTATGTGIASLSFRGDDGADELFNIGTIAGLTFGGGADDDVLTNSGTILSALNFGGDDGIDALRNFGSIASLTFTGGADDDALTNNLAGSITSLNFGGDDGIDALTNFGSIASLTFGGGADDDVLTNRGSITATLNFGGDDGVDILINTGTIASLTFGGGADDDVLTNDSDGSIANLTFIGGADDDVLTNRGSITTTLSFGGDDGSDSLTNFGSVASLTFGGGADDDVLTNNGGGSIVSLTFTGGADDDVLINFGTITASLNFGGDDGSDQLRNSGSITELVFTGGADDDVLTNNGGGSIAALTFTGGADDDVFTNAGSIAALTFTGGADDDVLLNTGTIITLLSFGGDDGLDALTNSGSIATLTFGGGADDDVLTNTFGGSIQSLTFTGGADDDVVLNLGTITATLNFGGDDGADVLSNRGTIASLVFTGGADDDVLTNDPGGSIASLNFGGDDGVDILLNHGAMTSLTFNGGADDDVFAHLGGLISTLNFGGDDGDDLLVVRGSVQSLTFTGGADDDVLQVSSGLIGSLDFNGDDGDDVLVNRAGGLASLTFTGGADDDILINRGHGLSSLTFIGGDGDDIFVNSGSANVLSPAVLLFEPGEGSNAMRNEGSGWADVRYIGTADTDGLRDENFLQNNGRGLGQLTYISGSGANAFENNASGLTAIAFTGSADDDTFANDGDNVSSILFDGLAGNDTLINTGTRVSDIEFTGGADDDRFINTGEELEHTYFAGGAGDDRVFNRGREVLDFTFIGDEGADWWINEISASGGEELSLLAGDDDDAADVFVNFAANVYGITFDGGVGNDVLQNFGPNSLYFSFFGGTGDDQFLNRGEGAHGFSFDAGDGSDTFENRGRNGGVFSMVGGYGDDTFFQSGGLAYSVELSGDAGRDSLINFSDFVSQLILSGGDDDDLLQNSGQFVSVIILMGGGGSNLLQNFGSDIEWLAILPDGTGTESAHDTLRNSGNRVQSIQVTTDGTATLVSSGSDIGSVLLAGGEHGDVVQLSGTNIAAIEVHGNGGDDSLLLDVNSPVGSSVMFTGGAGSDLLIFRGAVDSLLFDGGADDDLVVFSGTVATAILRGGDDDDQYQFAAAPIGQVTIDEVLTGISATDLSRDLLDFSAFTSSPITLDLALTTPQPQPSPSGRLVLTLTNGMGIEDVIGTAGADTIFGNARDNHFAGAQFLTSISAGSGTPVARTKTQWVYLDFVNGLNAGEFPYSPDDITAIVTRLQQIYAGFDVRFVTTIAELPDEIEFDPSQFVTITFNETPNTGRPGGEASEIDFGNVNPGGTAVVQVSGLLGGREVLLPLSARVQPVDDGHHDGDRIEAPDVPKPASTSDNFRALSAKIAAHELSHLLGIRHYDAFGPVGFGISAQPGSGEFAPAYPGLIAAFETADHIVSSPASTGTTRFNDLRSLYFGEREAIKLALAFSDEAEVRVDEPAATHDSQATAAPLTLVTLAVPGITGSAFSKDKQLTVTAISVVGDISLGTDGHSASDWYSITGQAGDVVTIEVLSRSLQRYLTDSQTSIDSVVRVFDADGELIQLSGGAALNDDEFESSDSVLMDVRLPAAGTFFIEVDTFRRQPGDPGYDIALARRQELESRRDDANDLTPAEVQLLARLADSLDDTDTGNYELFVYRLTRANQADQADVLKGRGGVDTLIDEPGEDYVIPASITGPNSVAEASLWNGSLNFTDVRGDSWSISINYGDETSTVNGPGAPGSQSLSHSFADNGTYIVTATITNDDGIITSRTFSVTVTNVAPTVTLTGPTTGITGTGLNYSVSASDVAGAADPLSYSWTITRNGSDFTTQSGGLTYSLNASLPGTYRVSVTVNDGDGGVVTRFVDVVVAPAVTPPAVTGFDVNTGLAQRSFIAAVDTVFSTSQLANELLQSLNTATPRVTLTKFSLAGTNGANVPLTTGMSTLPGNATGLRFDFGNRVIGATAAARNAKTADGYYRLAFDLDGNGSLETTRHFYRLLGDINGDRIVNVTDDNAVRAAIAGYNPPPPARIYRREADVNGDNANNNTDRVSLLRNNNARLGSGLSVDD